MPPVGAASEGQLDKRAELDQPRRLVGRRLRIGRSLSDRHLHASNASAGVRTCLSRKRGDFVWSGLSAADAELALGAIAAMEEQHLIRATLVDRARLPARFVGLLRRP
jgi:hypothetical protein